MKRLIHQRHLFLRQRHRCLRRARRLHHLRFLRQRHQCSRRVKCLHHPMCPLLLRSGTIQMSHNWCIFLVHAGCCRRPRRDRNTGLQGSGSLRAHVAAPCRSALLLRLLHCRSLAEWHRQDGGTVRILFNLGETGRLRGTDISYFTANFSTIGAGATFFRFCIFRGGTGWTYLLVDFSVGVCGSGRDVAKSCIGRVLFYVRSDPTGGWFEARQCGCAT